VSTAYRSSASVINATAGTSVVITKPAATADDDQLIAFIGQAGTSAVTPPAGWTLIGTKSASTTLTVAAYRKLAASEGASWTWTLGSSVRNFGVVQAYTGVDPTTPIYASSSTGYDAGGSSFSPDAIDRPFAGQGVSCAAAVRTASGSATTWGHSSTERVDISTNAGAGTDITAVVGDGTSTSIDPSVDTDYTPVMNASQAQAQAVVWKLTLRPYFTPFAAATTGFTVEAAWGADPDGDSSLWVFVPITSDVLTPNGGLDAAVTIRKGSPNEGSVAPTNIAFTLRNFSGQYTPGNASGSNYPNVRRNTPIRVSVTGFGSATTYERATCFVDSWTPSWDTSLRVATVAVSASGRLRRMGQGGGVLASSLRRAIEGAGPAAYWPVEDGTNAQSIASAVAGQTPAIGVDISYATDTSVLGSAPLPSLADGDTIFAPVTFYTDTGYWIAFAVFNIPTAVAATTVLLNVVTNGTARRWSAEIQTGAPDTVHIRAYANNGASLLDDSFAVDEAVFYGQPFVLSIQADQNGANVDYAVYVSTLGGQSGTLAAQTAGVVRSLQVPPSVDLDGVAVGHLAVFTDSSYTYAATTILPLDGRVGADPASSFGRFYELSRAADVPFTTITGDVETAIGMGPEPIASYPQAIAEMVEVDGGIVHDGGPLGEMVFVTRSSHYNDAVAMTVDMSAFELQPPLQPTFDDQNLRTTSTVTRSGGSSATFTGDTSEGFYPDPVTLSLSDDSHLYEIAGWRVARGKADDLRYPGLGINLFRTPALAEQWLSCRIGSRVQATLSMAHAPTAPDVLIAGYVESISSRRWAVVANCLPFKPYIVGVLDSDTLGKLDTAGCTLHATWNGVSGTFTVDTSTGPLWTTDSGEYPFDLNLAGQRVTVSGCTGSSNPQTFTVSVASVNGVSKTHTAGESVSLWSPIVLAL